MKILKDEPIAPIYMRPGDKLSVNWKDEHLVTHDIDTAMIVNHVTIVELQDEHGFKTGLGCFIGDKE